MNIRSYLFRLKSFIMECRRVLKVTKKPSKDEFKVIVKASGMGMIILGLIGFAIHMIKVLFIPS